MKLAILSLILLLAIAAFAAKETIVALNDTNFEEYLAKPVVIVKYYASWCSHCQILAPEYEKFAKMASDLKLGYVVAELEAPKNPKASEKAGIKHYPTIMIYLKGNPIEYSGDKKAKAIFEYVAQKVMISSAELTTESDITEAKEEKGRKCFLIADNNGTLRHYMNVAKNVDGFKYYHISEELGKTAFPAVKAPAVVLLKNYDDNEVVYSEQIENDNYIHFLLKNKYPVMGELTYENIRSIFQKGERKGVLFLHKGNSEEVKKQEQEFRLLAEQNQNENYVFISADLETDIGKPLIEFYTIKEAELPLVEIADGQFGAMRRYKHKGEMTLRDLSKFMSDFKKAKIERFVKSEDLPTENAGPVFVAVGSTFAKEVIDNDQDVIVKFYASWCGESAKFAPVFKQLAEKMKEVKTLKFVQVEATKNEIEKVSVQDFPTVMLYPAKKKASPIHFEEDKTEENLVKFLQEQCTHPIAAVEKKPDL